MIGKHARIYCCEDLSFVENYDKAINDNTQIWDCHHRLEVREDGTQVLAKELEDQGLFYNRPACELIFLTKAEHTRLHNYNRCEETKQKMSDAHKGNTYRRGKKLSEETKRKMSESNLGDKNGMYGKHHSEETKKKTRESMKKYWEDKKKKMMEIKS